MIRKRKDKTKLIAQTRLKLGWHKPYQIDVFIWQDSEALIANSPGRDDSSQRVSGIKNFTVIGAYNSQSWVLNQKKPIKEIPKVIGELHFVKGEASVEIVVHELIHATMHILVLLSGLEAFTAMYEEEKVCYTIGQLGKDVTKFLYAHDAFSQEA
jgi:hypothetical protein